MRYQEIKDALERYLAGEINANELKPLIAPHGVYQQRNDAGMARIRVTGGHLEVEKLRLIAEIMEHHAVGYVHLTTRQDIQLHDVPLPNIHQVMVDCTEAGLPFRGGCGNTFRNILVNPDSGISPGGVFDVIPYALGLRDVIFACEKAFFLPRKFKIGLVDRPELERLAMVQDMGFIAARADGKRGFTVYGGGGMGRNSALGVKLFDFLPEEDLPRCVLAMIEMFFEHGDRTNRNRARIRYILERLGKEAFAGLFSDYYRKNSTEVKLPAYRLELDSVSDSLKKADGESIAAEETERWKQLAASATRFGGDAVSIRIFVPDGNLRPAHLRKLAGIAELTGCPFIRLTPEQDILLPLVHRSLLPLIYAQLKNELPELDLTLNSFKGHIVSCIGASVCKIGILDAPQTAWQIAARLDDYFAGHPDKKSRLACRIISDIRISGCPNSCSAHPNAAIGLQGQKNKFDTEVEPAYLLFTGASSIPFALSQATGGPVKADEVPERLLQMIMDKYSKADMD